MNRQTARHSGDAQRETLIPATGVRWAAAILFVLTATASLAEESKTPPVAETAAPGVEFEHDIQPLFAKHCLTCHGPTKRESGLRLDLRSEALLGGDSGPAIFPGNNSKSLLAQRITSANPDERMPPDQSLNAEQIALIKAWIDQGAKWPDSVVGTSSGSRHWSFQPVARPALPSAQGREWPRNEIDRFVLARQEEFGIESSPEADRYTLIRRLSLDLTGLPPTPGEVLEFSGDTRPDAYERLVERLLASPHFGECWALYWLDLARYADSDGYEMDHHRPHAWQWRDWVINAINEDMPFDAFTIEQLAGDLLPHGTPAQQLATGFHRNTLTNRENGIDREEFRLKAIVDRVNTTGTVWLGLTVGCAECHSHKYDPLSQREYYQLVAFFNDRVDEADLPVPGDAETVVHAFVSRDKPRITQIHLRGNFLETGEAVQPGTPAVLPPITGRSGDAPLDRLDMARWLMAPENPLTARVECNRVWQHLFGVGLVKSEDDFGVKGEPPTHPELLDWLATEFVSHGWSRKELIRRIVNSATYRQSSDHRTDLADIDPLNLWLARQNRYRLEAELIRDQYLAVSGLLNERVGGPGFRPPLPESLARLAFRLSWEPDQGPELYRRSMYITFMRNTAYPMLTTFDRTEANVTCTRRERSNTPLQSLTQLNDPLFMESARSLGLTLLSSEGNTDTAIDDAFSRVVARRPTKDERRVLVRLYAECVRIYGDDVAAAGAVTGNDSDRLKLPEAAAWIVVARTILNLDEFVTRE